jgi:hypothetical protein
VPSDPISLFYKSPKILPFGNPGPADHLIWSLGPWFPKLTPDHFLLSISDIPLPAAIPLLLTNFVLLVTNDYPFQPISYNSTPGSFDEQVFGLEFPSFDGHSFSPNKCPSNGEVSGPSR